MPAGAQGAELMVRLEPAELRKIVADLKALEDGKVLVAGLRRNLRKAAEPVRAQVRSNASWSTRIPSAVVIGTSFTARRTGVFIAVNSKKAPEARPLENKGRNSMFRHPLFGNRNRWVYQPARPFFFQSTGRFVPAVEMAVAEAVDEAARAAGFR